MNYPIPKQTRVSRRPVYTGGTSAIQCLDLMLSQRVAIISMGDSNQYRNGHGYHSALEKALIGQGRSMYATPLIAPNVNNGNGRDLGYGYDKALGGFGASSGAPAALDDYDISDVSQMDQAWVADGDNYAAHDKSVVIETGNLSIDISGQLTAEYHYGALDPANYTNTGEFYPQIKQKGGGSLAANDGATSVMDAGNAGTVQRYDITAAAADRSGWSLGAVCPWGSNPTTASPPGPMFALYNRFIQPTTTVGFALDSLVSQGGVGVRSWANTLVNDIADTGLDYWLGEQRRLSNNGGSFEPRALVVINLSAHDRNESSASVGPQAVSDGDSAEAYEDNLTAIIRRIEDRWSANGWDPEEVSYLLVGHFPGFDGTNDRHPRMEHFHAVARAMANGSVQSAISQARHRIGFVDPGAYTSMSELEAISGYETAGNSHLEPAGMDLIYGRAVQHLLWEWR